MAGLVRDCFVKKVTQSINSYIFYNLLLIYFLQLCHILKLEKEIIDLNIEKVWQIPRVLFSLFLTKLFRYSRKYKFY